MKSLLRLNLALALAAMLLTVFTVGTPGIAKADSVLASNLSETVWYYDPLNTTLGNWAACSFSTGIGDHTSYTLNSVTLDAYQTIAGTTVQMYLFSNNPAGDTPGVTGLPGTAIATLTSPSFTNTMGDLQTFTTGGITLAADSYYWIVLEPLSGDLEWAFAYTSDGSKPGFQPGWAASYDGGLTWANNFGDTEPYKMQVDANAVPIPTTLLLLGSGLLGLAGLRRRTKA